MRSTMPVVTDITFIPKQPSVTAINPAIFSEVLLDAMQALGCYTELGENGPVFDRKVNMRFVKDVMIGRFPIYYPYADGEVTSKQDGLKYTQRTPSIYYALGSIDREGFEGCPQALQSMNDFVTVSVHSNESGIDLIKRTGLEILKLTKDYRVFFRKTDTNNEYTELFI